MKLKLMGIKNILREKWAEDLNRQFTANNMEIARTQTETAHFTSNQNKTKRLREHFAPSTAHRRLGRLHEALSASGACTRYRGWGGVRRHMSLVQGALRITRKNHVCTLVTQ